MKKLIMLLSLLILAGNVYGATSVSLTYTISNGQTADATEVQANDSELGAKQNTHNAATTGEHGVTGTIVGTSDTQTLTNKTLTAPTVTTIAITDDATWTTGKKAIFGNAARYIKDNTSVYAIEFGTHTVIPQGGKLYFDGGSTRINMTSSSNSVFDINDSTTLRMRIDSTGDVFIQGAYDDTTGASANVVVGATGQLSRSTSARKYKTNERPLPYNKTKLMGLKAILYNSKCDGDDKKKDFIGIVADDALLLYPELVILGADNQPEGFNYERLTVVLLTALQDQQKQLGALTKRIEKLEAK